MLRHQPVIVFRVEQEGLRVVGFPSEVVHQDALVKHHLHIVVFLVPAVVLVPLAGLLLDKDFQVFLEHVGTSLQAELFAHERGFEQGVPPVEVRQVAGQDVVDERTDVQHLLLCRGMEIGGEVAGAELQCRRSEELLQGLCVRHRGVRLFVDVIVQELAGEVSQQDGRRIGARLDFIEEEVKRMMPVLAEASRQRADVNQVIGMRHDEFRDVFMVFVDTGVQEVELHVFLEQFAEVAQVVVVSPLEVIDDDERVRFVVR